MKPCDKESPLLGVEGSPRNVGAAAATDSDFPGVEVPNILATAPFLQQSPNIVVAVIIYFSLSRGPLHNLTVIGWGL